MFQDGAGKCEQVKSPSYVCFWALKIVWDEARLRFVKSFCQVQRAREIKLEISISTWWLVGDFSASRVNSLHFICNAKHPTQDLAHAGQVLYPWKRPSPFSSFELGSFCRARIPLNFWPCHFSVPIIGIAVMHYTLTSKELFAYEKVSENGSRNWTSLGLLQLWFHSLPFLCGSGRVH